MRTKDRRAANRACLLKSLIVDKFFQYPAPWEVYAEECKRRYLEGMRLLRAYGRIDLVDEFALDGLTDEGVDLELYLRP